MTHIVIIWDDTPGSRMLLSWVISTDPVQQANTVYTNTVDSKVFEQ